MRALHLTGLLFATAASAASYPQPEGQRLDIGDGFDGIAGQQLPRCLEKPKTSQGTYQKAEFTLERVRSIEDFQRNLGVTAAAKFGAGVWSGSAKLDLFSSQKYTDLVVYLFVRVRVTNAEVKIEEPTIRPELAKKTMAQFRSQCGDAFVASTVSGGEFAAVFKYQATSREDAERFAASFSFGTISNAASADIKQGLSKVTSSERTTVSILRKGASGPVPPPDIETIIKYAIEFPEKVKADAFPIAFSTLPYSVISPGLKNIDLERAARDTAIIRMGQKFDLAQTRLSSADQILGNSNSYCFKRKAEELKKLQADRARLSKYVADVRKTFKACVDPDVDCDDTAIGNTPEIVEPGPVESCACRQWSGDDKFCTQCRILVGQRGGVTIPHAQTGFNASCSEMKPGETVKVALRASVKVAESNGTDWIVLGLRTPSNACSNYRLPCGNEITRGSPQSFALDNTTVVDMKGVATADISAARCSGPRDNLCVFDPSSELTFSE